MSTVTLKKFKKNDHLGKSMYKDAKIYFTVELAEGAEGSRKQVLTDDKEIKEFSEYLGVPESELRNPNSVFWRDYTYVMQGSSVELDDSKMGNKLALKVLATNSRVISSEEELTKKSKAEFILEKATEITERKVSRRDLKSKAFSRYATMSDENFKDVLLVYGKNPRDLSSTRIKEIVGDEMESNPEKFLKIIEDKNFEYKVFINDLVQGGLLKKSGTGYIYDGEMIAHDNNSMLGYVKDPKNQNNVIAFKKQLNLQYQSKKFDV